MFERKDSTLKRRTTGCKILISDYSYRFAQEEGLNLESKFEVGSQFVNEPAEAKVKSIRDYLDDYPLGFELPDIKILLMDNVYSPKYDSLLLGKRVTEVVTRDDRVLDIGTGSGILALLAAVRGAEVVATDIDRGSVQCAEYNARLNNLRIDARVGDLFDSVAEESFDIVVSNAPSLPTVPSEQYDKYTARNINGGWDGRKYIDPLIEQVPKYLKRPGYLLIIHSNFANSERTKEKLGNLGFDVRIEEYEFANGIDSQQRVDYFIKKLPPSCRPLRKGGIWYQRMHVFQAFLR
jgi:release factor glutamine methyltransferase